MESRGLDWSDPAVLSIDVAYHDIEHSRSVYRLLEQNDETQRLFDESDIRDAIDDPPPNSRATVRALFIKISEALEVNRIHVRWDGLGEVIETVKLKDPDTMPYEEIAKLMKILLRFTEEYKRKQKEENFREPSPIPNT